MDTSTGTKTHRAALAVLPPEPLWPPIQAFRRRHDRQHHRWPPHVDLLYPFLTPAAWTQAQARILAVCSRQAPFELTLDGPRWFEHRPHHYTLWLAPEPAEALVALHRALREAVPQCDDLDRLPGGYTPHLSVGQARGRRALARLLGWRSCGGRGRRRASGSRRCTISRAGRAARPRTSSACARLRLGGRNG